jgi:hypothetical protein
MDGGLRLPMYLNFVLSLVECVATRLSPLCLHVAFFDGLHVCNGILKTGGIQHDTMDRRDLLARGLDTGFGDNTCN